MRRQLLPRDLGFDVLPRDEPSLFKWFLASFLFGNRISQAIAAETWRVIVEVHGRDTPARLCECTHAQLVRLLGEGGYRRYDASTADRLKRLCRALLDDYDGRILGIAQAAGSQEEFERRLLQFRGVGPVTFGIFMREAGPAIYGGDRVRPAGEA